jgi:hypothetical protein
MNKSAVQETEVEEEKGKRSHNRLYQKRSIYMAQWVPVYLKITIQ